MKKTALVTGSSRGIGAAAALALAARGWCVHVNYLHSGDAAAKIAAQTGGLAIQADVADPAAVEAMFRQTGPVSLLVNNAGICYTGLLTDMTSAEWQRLFDVNITGMYNCCRCAIGPMVDRKAGHILNMASVLGVTGGSCEVAYSATKGAVIAFTKALSKELGPSQIRVNCIAPGCIETAMLSNLSDAEKAVLADATSLCRLGTPEDVAAVVAALAEPETGFLTGQCIGVDGGLLI